MVSIDVRPLVGPIALLAALVPSLSGCDGGSGQPSAGGPERLPQAQTVRECPSAVYGTDIAPMALRSAVDAGRLTLAIEGGWLGLPARAYAPNTILKVLALVRTGKPVTLVVPASERARLSLLYDVDAPGPRRPLRLADGTWSVRFSACARGEGWSQGRSYPDPDQTQFNGGFFVRGAHCAPLDVWTAGAEAPVRRWLPLGTGDRPCPR
jgi:hypothetical protein